MRLHGKTLLVSAAAGSGKTSVLTERIIRSLTDREHPADLSRMLIVTFTRAAAAELKGRIAEALSRAMAEYPNDPHLQRQLFLLGSAQISTIDSFFQKAVRANFEQLGLPSSFRIADDSEIAPLCTEILDGLIEEYYQRHERSSSTGGFSAIKENPFAKTLDHLMSNRSDGKLDHALLDLQRSFASYPEGITLLHECAERLRREAEDDYFRSTHGRAVRRHLEEQFSACCTLLEELEEQLKTDPDAWRKLSGLFCSDRDYCRAMLEALEKEHYPQASLLSVSFVKGTFPTIKEKSAAVLSYQAWRTKFKKDLEKVQELLHWTPEEIADQMRRTADFCEMLHTFFAEYEARLLAEKKTRGILEYNDVRAMLFSLLNEKDGSPTPFARSLAAQYDAVYIDEYQDVDFMQDRIFARIGEKNRRFMVGDIKQSIYRFRGSEPSIFANYRRTMPLYTEEEAKDADGVCVFMSDNFRCDRPVIDFANRICAFLFSACESSVGYRPQDDLICAKSSPEHPLPGHPAPVEVHVFGAAPRKGKHEENEAEAEDGIHEEAIWVAREIRRLLTEGQLDDGSAVTPSDIAVLVRYKSHAKAYLKAMELLGIPTVSAVSKDIFEEPLMVDMRNLLRALDNPYRDLPLSEFLLSPLSEYTLEELSLIRSSTDANASLFDSMESAARDPETYGELASKCARTVSDLQRLQALSAGEPADRFLRVLYAEEALKPYAKDAVLLYLYDQARLYQRSSFCGLYGFLEHLDSLAESKKASAEGFRATERAVTVMTVHHSKGLEFPVVFLASSGALFNKEDSKKTVLYHREIGCATKLYNPETGENENTALRTAVVLETENEQAEESIRTLYVALTRARERLYVTGTLRGKWDSALENATLIRYGDRASILHATNPLLWVLAAMSASSRIKESYPTPLVHHPYGSVLAEDQKESDEEILSTPVEEEAHEKASSLALRFARVLDKQKEFAYPRAFLEGLPAKAAASKLSSSLLDTLLDEENAEVALDAQIRLLDSADRSFDSILLSSKTPSAAEIGTATHTFLEFCDYRRLVSEGVDAECHRLLDKGFIGERTAELLNRRQLEGFRRSELMQWIAEADEVWREQTFSLLLPMSDFTLDKERKALLQEERLFVQGSIDCLIRRKDGKLILIDYKTDRISKEEELNREALIRRMAEHHGSQLNCYAKAVEHLFGKAPDEIYVYSLPLGELIPFTP